MAEERVIEGVGFKSLTKEDIDKLTDDELSSRMLEVAERGIVAVRTNISLPPDVHGHWVSNTPEDIAAAEMYGFEIDTKYAPASKTHSDGKGNPIVGDVIHMIRPMRLHQAYLKAQDVLFRRTHMNVRGQAEEDEFVGNVRSSGLSTKFKGSDINTSITERVSAGQINAMIKGDGA